MYILKKILGNKRMVKYFLMAVAIVSIELITFQLIYVITNNYYYATIISFLLAVILNWYFGRILVFGKSKHNPSKEFTMVLVASLIGVSVQVLVMYISINFLGLMPLIGKAASIIFSFFWNYWFRSKIIYK